jgi:hypothetical protein
MKNILEVIETKLQTLIEGSVKLLPLNSPEANVALSILNELRKKVISSIEMNEPLPNVFSISLHPEINETLSKNTAWINEIEKTMLESAQEYNKPFYGNITFEFFTDEELPVQGFKINSYTIFNELEKTAVLKTNQSDPQPHPIMIEAYLILPNKELFPLRRTITQIGRKNDNHLIIDNPTISRNHAQIRNVNGNFMIFDLNSTSGTFVNGVRVHQALLRSGDVISIANYPLVYGVEDENNNLDHGSTAEIPRIVDTK